MARSRKRALGRNDPISEEDPTANLAALKQLIDETTADIELLVQPDQSLAQEVCSTLASATRQMWRYSQLVSLGKETAAQYVLTSIGQSLLKAARISSEQLSELDVKAAAYATAEAALQEAAMDGALGSEMAMNLSLAVSQSVAIYKELTGFDQTIDSLRKEVARASSDWSLDDDAPGIQEHLRWLGGGQAGFTTLASRYLINRSLYDEDQIATLRDEAENHLSQLEEVTLNAKRLHRQTLQKAQTILGGKQERYAELLKQLQKQRDTLQSQSAELTSTLIKGSALLSDDELADWAAYEALPKFQNLDQTRHDLHNVVARIWRRLDSQPQLTANAKSIIDEARHYTDSLFDELEEDAAPIALPEPIEAAKPQPIAPRVATPSPSDFLKQKVAAKTPATQPAPAVATERVDEIYEMILAVAAHRYCGERFLQGMTISSVLGILLFMKKISEEEFKTCVDAVTQKVMSRSKSVEDTKKVTDAWRTTSPTVLDWIDYPNGKGGRFFKLVLQGKEPALHFASRLGITDETTLTAKDQYNKVKTKLRKA